MKRLLILIFICFNVQILYGMEAKHQHADQKAAVESAHIVSQDIAFSKIWHLQMRTHSATMSKNHRVAVVEGFSVTVHDLDGNLLCSHLLDKRIKAISARTISDDGRFVAFACTDGKVGIMDVDNKDTNSHLEVSEKLYHAYQIAFDRQAQCLVILGLEYSLNNTGYRPYLALLDKNLQETKRVYLDASYIKQDDRGQYLVGQIAISPNGQHIAAVTPAGLFFWDTQKNDVSKHVTPEHQWYRSVAACDDATFATVTAVLPEESSGAEKGIITSVYTYDGKLVKKSELLKVDTQGDEKVNLWFARLAVTADGLRIFFLTDGARAMVDFETGKLLHQYTYRQNEYYFAGYNGVIGYKNIPFAAADHTAVVYESPGQKQARVAAYAPIKAAALRKKKVMTAVVCIAGAVAAYIIWKKYKKKKRAAQSIDALTAMKKAVIS